MGLTLPPGGDGGGSGVVGDPHGPVASMVMLTVGVVPGQPCRPAINVSML